MKKFVFFSFFSLAIALQLSAADISLPNSFASSDFGAEISTRDLQETEAEFPACYIVSVRACGGSVSSQYCDEGLHGTLDEWVDYLEGELCERQADQ